VRNIWHRLLVNRDGPAFRAFTNTVDTRHEAHEHYTRELLNITDAASFNSNEPIRRAFEKTRLLAQTMCQREQTTSFASLVMVHHLPPFLLWLAVVDDPECLVTVNNGTLPLHEAMKASVACRRPVQPNRIHFKAATSSSGDPLSSEQIKLIELFNKTTAVQLLCHLSPRACKIAHAPSPEDPPRLPLDMFLSSLALEQERIRREGHFQWILFTHELLQDIRAIIAKAPQALETRSLPTRVYPFCLPQLNWSNSSVSVSSSASIRCEDDNVAIATECFLLTLAFDLLQQNPTVVTRNCDPNFTRFEPRTAYEQVLKQRIQTEVEQTQKLLLQKRETLKRKLEALHHEHATFLLQAVHRTQNGLGTTSNWPNRDGA
jgi:hypothetical protein